MDKKNYNVHTTCGYNISYGSILVFDGYFSYVYLFLSIISICENTPNTKLQTLFITLIIVKSCIAILSLLSYQNFKLVNKTMVCIYSYIVAATYGICLMLFAETTPSICYNILYWIHFLLCWECVLDKTSLIVQRL